MKADTRKRFKNYLIDTIICLNLTWPISLLVDNVFYNVKGQDFLIHLIIIRFFYYIVFEYIFGRTIGKASTKTKVINYNNKRPSFLNILGRTLCRAIPLNAFSIFINEDCFHDTVSKTSVVNED